MTQGNVQETFSSCNIQIFLDLYHVLNLFWGEESQSFIRDFYTTIEKFISNTNLELAYLKPIYKPFIFPANPVL